MSHFPWCLHVGGDRVDVLPQSYCLHEMRIVHRGCDLCGSWWFECLVAEVAGIVHLQAVAEILVTVADGIAVTLDRALVPSEEALVGVWEGKGMLMAG